MENQENLSEENVYDDAEDFKEYKTPVTITNKSQSILISWSPLGILIPILGDDGSASIIDAIRNIIKIEELGGYVKVTPEGPSLPATTANLYTVMWAAYTLLGPSIYVEGGGPTMSDLGISKDDEQDPDGNPIVR